MICAGFDGASEADAPIEELRSLAVGGVILFARNVGTLDELRRLNAALVELDPETPPFVAVDQEGGRVARLRSGIVELPAAMAFGAADDPAASERAARALGRDLRALGFTADFAPCADLAVDPANTVIGNRSFGDDPARVAPHVRAFVRGLQSGGVAACAKHFPGHGATAADSHREVPVVSADAALLERREFVPFAAAVDAGAAMLMTAHVVVPALDGAHPATLSSAVLRIARERLGFSGVIVSDALEMDAIAGGAGIASGAAAAIGAGVDCAVVGSDLRAARAARDAIVAAVERGTLPLARLEEAAGRVRALRRTTFARASAGGDDERAAAEIARRAVTEVRGRARLADGAPVTVVSFEGALGDGASASAAAPSLSAALRARRRKSENFRVALDPGDDDVALLLEVLAQQAGRTIVLLLRRAHRYPRQAAAARAVIERHPDAFAIAAREPYDLLDVPNARTAIAIYGDEGVSIEGLADVLCGRAAADGRLPVTLGDFAAR